MLVELGMQGTVIISTHIVSDVADTCRSVAIVQHGQVVAMGTPGELAARAAGRVWSGVIAPGELPEIERVCTVAASALTADGIEVRLVGTPPPHLTVRPQPPTLEDGYLALIGPTEVGATDLAVLSHAR